MKSLLLLSFCCFLVLPSCRKNLSTTQTKIKFDLTPLQEKEIQVLNIPQEISLDVNGSIDSISLELDNEIILELKQGWSHSYLHVKPDDNLEVGEVKFSSFGIGLLGEKSVENQYLEEFQKIHINQMEEFMSGIEDITTLPADGYKSEISNISTPLKELLSKVENDQGVSDYFKNAIKARYVAVIINNLSYYKGFYHNYKKEYPKIPDDFYELFASGNFTDPAYLIFEESREALSFYPSKDLNAKDYKSSIEYYKATNVEAESIYGETLTKEYFSYELINNLVNYASIDDAMEFVNSFKSTSKSKYLMEKLDETLEPWKGLESGNPAPNFQAMTRDGEVVELDSLQGKKVYVDVWATWCGPCIAEIPFLKELEEELHDQDVTFVSVSIDEDKDKEKWQNYVVREQLKGVQLMAEGAWKSDVVSAYNIAGIPRFLLISEDGKILSSNAPRPSDESLKEILMD